MNALLPIRRSLSASSACGASPRFISLEHMLRVFLPKLFPGYDVLGQGLFRIIRDSDIEIEEEAEDLVRVFESALKRRRRGVVIRMEVDADCPPGIRGFIADQLDVTEDVTVTCEGLVGYADTSSSFGRTARSEFTLIWRASRTRPRSWRRLLCGHPAEGLRRPPPL